jgi:DNA-directed RNA polymerase specialized sigma24 family protein
MAYDPSSPFLSDSQGGETLSPELLASLHEDVERLPDDLRRCFLLRHSRGFCESEIAVLMKLPIEDVRSCLRMAWRRLRTREREEGS